MSETYNLILMKKVLSIINEIFNCGLYNFDMNQINNHLICSKSQS